MYVDEYLLEKAIDIDAEVYIRRLLGGFVMSYSEPEFGSCSAGNEDADVTELEVTVSSSFTQCRMIDGRDFYTLVNSPEFITIYPWLGDVYYCPLLVESGSASGLNVFQSEVINGNSLVDGFSANLVQSNICDDIFENDLTGPPAIFTSDFTKQKISATVYYNNNVNHNRVVMILYVCDYTSCMPVSYWFVISLPILLYPCSHGICLQHH